MKKFLFITLALSLTLVSQAADAPATGAKKPWDDATLKTYDTNGDGKLDRNELAAMRKDSKKKKALRKNTAPPKSAPGLAEPGVPLVPTK